MKNECIKLQKTRSDKLSNGQKLKDKILDINIYYSL